MTPTGGREITPYHEPTLHHNLISDYELTPHQRGAMTMSPVSHGAVR